MSIFKFKKSHTSILDTLYINKKKKNLSPEVGIELLTSGLRTHCLNHSAIEASISGHSRYHEFIFLIIPNFSGAAQSRS